MKKRKVRKLVITFDDGTSDEFTLDGVMSESINSRKKAGFANLQEWVEYHITWITLIEDLPEVPVAKAPQREKSMAEYREEYGPLFAGISDNVPYFREEPVDWHRLFEDFTPTKENGNRAV